MGRSDLEPAEVDPCQQAEERGLVGQPATGCRALRMHFDVQPLLACRDAGATYVATHAKGIVSGCRRFTRG